MKNRPKIVIIGANFAGLAAARQITHGAEVILIDPSPYFEFIPNIHELISGEKSPSSLRINRAVLIKSMGHTWIQAKVMHIDAPQKNVELDTGEVIGFDACIVATGGVDNYRGVKGAETFAYPFKSVEDCHRIGQKFNELKEEGFPFSIVIVGGGSEGIEGLGELLRGYDKSIPLHIHVVEAQDRLLPQLSSKVSDEIIQLCKKFPVEFHFHTRIETVKEKEVVLSNGNILTSDLTIWTGGVQPNPMLYASGLSKSSDNWASTDSYLQSKHFEHIFLAGDAADLGGNSSKQAYFAIETGELAGKNVKRFLKKQKLMAFYKLDRPFLYSFGELSSFFIWGEFVIAGKSIGVLKESIYQKTMADFKDNDLCASLSSIYQGVTQKVQDELADSIKSFIHQPLSFLFTPPLKLL